MTGKNCSPRNKPFVQWTKQKVTKVVLLCKMSKKKNVIYTIFIRLKDGVFVPLEWLQITKLVLWNFAIIPILPFLNNSKDLDPSFKMDLDLWDCFERKKLHLITEEIWYLFLLRHKKWLRYQIFTVYLGHHVMFSYSDNILYMLSQSSHLFTKKNYDNMYTYKMLARPIFVLFW